MVISGYAIHARRPLNELRLGVGFLFLFFVFVARKACRRQGRGKGLTHVHHCVRYAWCYSTFSQLS